MTRKDYIKVANILRELEPILDATQFAELTNKFSRWFAEDNDRFDRSRFIAAVYE